MPSDDQHRHASDEELSAIVDGDSPAVLGDCATCAARLEAFSAVARSVAAPVAALAVHDSDRLVHAALAAGFDAAPQRSFMRPWVFALAAALLIVAGIPALLRFNAQDGGTASLASRDATSKNTAGGAASDAAAPDALNQFAGGVAPLAYLGDVDSADALVERVRAGMATAPPVAAALEARATGKDAPAGASSGTGSVAVADESSPTACEPNARRETGLALGALRYFGQLLWKGNAAVALVFDGAGGADDPRTAVVMSPGSCHVLVSQQF